MPALPYAIAAFMMTPFVLWMALWLFAFPGEKAGFEAHLTVAMLAISAPMAIGFLVSNLSFISNSMLKRDEFGLPAWQPARRLLLCTPAMTVLLGVIALGALAWMDGTAWSWIVVPLVTVACTWACHRTIKRARDGHPADRAGLSPSPLRQTGRAAVRVAGRAIYWIPVLGWMARDAAQGRPSAIGFLVLNLALAVGIATALFGVQALFVTALILVPMAFIAMIGLTRGQDA